MLKGFLPTLCYLWACQRPKPNQTEQWTSNCSVTSQWLLSFSALSTWLRTLMQPSSTRTTPWGARCADRAHCMSDKAAWLHGYSKKILMSTLSLHSASILNYPQPSSITILDTIKYCSFTASKCTRCRMSMPPTAWESAGRMVGRKHLGPKHRGLKTLDPRPLCSQAASAAPRDTMLALGPASKFTKYSPPQLTWCRDRTCHGKRMWFVNFHHGFCHQILTVR